MQITADLSQTQTRVFETINPRQKNRLGYHKTRHTESLSGAVGLATDSDGVLQRFPPASGRFS